jgi:hypothetical protein
MDELFIIFERFSTLGMQQNRPGTFACLFDCPAPWKPARPVWDFLSYSEPIDFQIDFESIFDVGNLEITI